MLTIQHRGIWLVLAVMFFFGIFIMQSADAENTGADIETGDQSLTEALQERKNSFAQYIMEAMKRKSEKISVLALPEAYFKNHLATLTEGMEDGLKPFMKILLKNGIHIEIELCPSIDLAIQRLAERMATSSASDKILQERINHNWGDIALGDISDRDIFLIRGNLLLHVWATASGNRKNAQEVEINDVVQAFMKAFNESKVLTRKQNTPYFIFPKDLFLQKKVRWKKQKEFHSPI